MVFDWVEPLLAIAPIQLRRGYFFLAITAFKNACIFIIIQDGVAETFFTYLIETRKTLAFTLHFLLAEGTIFDALCSSDVHFILCLLTLTLERILVQLKVF